MKPGSLKLLGRCALAFLALPAIAFSISALGWAPGAFAVANPVRLVFSIAGIVLLYPRWSEALRVPEPYGPREYASLGLLDIFLGLACASVWSTRASAAMHLDLASIDIGLRLAFALFGIRGVSYLLLALGNIREDTVPASGYWRVGKIGLAALVILGLVGLTGKIWAAHMERTELHDVAPVGPDTDGRP